MPVLVLVRICVFSLLVASFTRLSGTQSGEYIDPSSRCSADSRERKGGKATNGPGSREARYSLITPRFRPATKPPPLPLPFPPLLALQ